MRVKLLDSYLQIPVSEPLEKYCSTENKENTFLPQPYGFCELLILAPGYLVSCPCHL